MKKENALIITDDAKIEFKQEFTDYKFRLDNIERNIVVALYSEVNYNDAPSIINEKRIYYSDIAKVCGLTDKDYNKIKKAVWNLFEKRFVYAYNEESTKGMHWLVNVEIYSKKPYFLATWNPDLLTFFLFPNDGGVSFVTSNRDMIISFDVLHTYRFYWWFRQWIFSKKELTLSLKKIADSLCLGKSYYDSKSPNGVNAGLIKRNIIDKCLDDLNNNSLCDITATARYNKVSRYYDSVTFFYNWKNGANKAKNVPVIVPGSDDKSVENKQKLTDEQKNMIKELVQLGLNRKNAKEFVEIKPLKEIRASIDYAKKQDAAGQITKSFGGFLRAAIADGYGVPEALAKEKRDEANKKMLADKAKEAEEKKKELEAAVEAKKRIKEDIFARTDEEKHNFIEHIKEEVNNLDEYRKLHYKLLIDNDTDYILSNDKCIDLIVEYIYILRNTPISINNDAD